MMRVALIACGAGKLPYRAPAWEFYTGSLTVAARRDVEAREVPYWFVSALHLLVPRHRKLQPYELRLASFTAAERGRWGHHVAAQLGELLRLDGRTVELHAGAVYAEALRGPLEALGALVEVVVPSSLQIGERLAWYAERARQRDLAPDLEVEPWTVTQLVSWAPSNEFRADVGDDPATYWPATVEPTAVAEVEWNPRTLKQAGAIIDPDLTEAQLDEDGLRLPPTLTSRLVVHRWAWRRLTRGGPRRGEKLALPYAMRRLARQLAGSPEALTLLAQAAEEQLAELAPTSMFLGRRARMVVKPSGTDPMLNITGQVTEMLVPGAGRVWIRETIGDRGRASAGERWGWHQGHTSRSREVLELAAPGWAWPFVAASVHALDGLHRRVVLSREWSLAQVRPTADLDAWRR